MGAPSYREVGGGPATGLANDFVSFLQHGLNTGSFGAGTAGQRFMGADPMGSTMGIGSVLNALLSGEAAGPMSELISKQGERDVAALRSRFGASGGMAFGTPAAFGEAVLRSETAPRIAQVVQQGQLAAISQLLPLFANISMRGITQREGVMQPSALSQAIGIAAPIIGTVAGSFGGPAGAAAGNAAGNAVAQGVAGQQPSIRNSVGAQEFMVPMPSFNMQWAPNLTPGSTLGPLALPPMWRN